MALDPGTSTTGTGMSAATEQLDLMKRARADQREDLQAVTDAHVALAASTILMFNQAKMNDLLVGADPNTPVDTPAGEDNNDPSSQPATESQS